MIGIIIDLDLFSQSGSRFEWWQKGGVAVKIVPSCNALMRIMHAAANVYHPPMWVIYWWGEYPEISHYVTPANKAG